MMSSDRPIQTCNDAAINHVVGTVTGAKSDLATWHAMTTYGDAIEEKTW